MSLAEGRKSLSKSRNVQLPIADISQNENVNTSVKYLQSSTPISQDIRNRKLKSKSHETINGVKVIRIYTSFLGAGSYKEIDILGNQTNSDSLKDELSGMFGIDKKIFREVFSIWVVSELFEVQIKPHHSPYDLLASWQDLLIKYVDKYDPNRNDEPIIMLRRNILLTNERESEIIDCHPNCAQILLTYAKESLLIGKIQFTEISDLLKVTAKLISLDMQYDNAESEQWIREHLEEYLPEKYCEIILGKTIFGKSINKRSENLDKLLTLWRQESESSQRAAQNRVNFLKTLSECSSSYGACWFDVYVEKKTSRVSVKSLGQSYKNVKAKVAITQDWITIVEHGTDELLLLQDIGDITWELNSENDEKVIVFNIDEECCTSGDETRINVESYENEITYFLMIFGNQTVLVDVLLNSLSKRKERSPSTTSSDSTTSSERHSSIVRKLNCNRLCLAKFENGTCKQANGSFKSVYKLGECIYS